VRTFLATAATLLATSPLVAQTSVALTKPDAELAEPFTRIRSIRETPSGKLLVSDMQDKVVQLVDLGAGTVTKVGREGQGPGEYALPSDLYAMPNGETWLNDLLGRRFLAIDASGKPGKNFPLPGSGGNGPGIVIGLTGGGSDGAGRIYYQAPPFNPANPNGPSPDSLAVLRWDPAAAKTDTAAWIKGPRAEVTSSGSGSGARFTMRFGTSKVFAPQDAWGVASDGAIARVTPNPYRVTWYHNGKPVAGPPVSYTPLKVTEEDKQQVIEARKRGPRPTMIAIGGDRRAVNPGDIRLPDPEFEETKPPFSGNNSVLVTPEGEVWVLRTRPASDKTPSYDVFDRTGKLTRKVTLRPSSAVVGFGKGTVYVVRTDDDDDLQYLERYRR